MAKQIKVAAKARSGTGRQQVKQIKREGMIPAVVYGGSQEARALQVAKRDIDLLLSHAVGEHFLVDLEIDADGSKTSTLAIIQEVQHHPVGGEILHVDFHSVTANETIEAEIPVEALGEANGVKNYGGILEQSLRALTVECLPANLPELIEVDVSALNVGDHLTVADLKLPEGVTALADDEQVVFVVAPPNVEEEEEPAAEAVTAPEVIREKKPSEEAE